MSELPYTSVVWDSDEGTRQDQAYEAQRYSDPPEIAAKRELIFALRGVEEWRRKGLWPPQEAQERLYRARVEAQRLGIGEIV